MEKNWGDTPSATLTYRYIVTQNVKCLVIDLKNSLKMNFFTELELQYIQIHCRLIGLYFLFIRSYFRFVLIFFYLSINVLILSRKYELILESEPSAFLASHMTYDRP